MQLTLSQALLVLIFQTARAGRRANLTLFCKRWRTGATALQGAFDELEERGLLNVGPAGERLTLEGLALGAALTKKSAQRRRPLATCRPLAA